MRRDASFAPFPAANEIAHAPELALLIALDAVLAATTVTIHLAVPELELLQRDHTLLDPQCDDRDLVVAQDILDLIGALRHTLHIYRDLTHRP